MTIPRLGILGGGQLARMLAMSAAPLGYSVKILCTSSRDPAALVCGNVQLGSVDDEGALKTFLAEVDVVTFESEFVDCSRLAGVLPTSVAVFPALTTIAAIQDRLTQKELLDRFKIPTSPWMAVESAQDLKQAAQRFSKGFVLKQRRFGYDGYGTFVCRAPADADPALLQKSKFGFIAEEFIPFRRELAFSLARSKSGEIAVLPLVETVQQDSRCLSVQGPVKHSGLAKMAGAFKRVMNDVDYHGILAVELFDGKSGLLVNELAPRVHNSAHHSLNSMTCDQFSYHWRAGLDLPLPKIELVRPGFAMVNLLGSGAPDVRLSASAAGGLHWYGKSENRPGRKLGHINVIDKSGKAALKRALKWRKEFQL